MSIPAFSDIAKSSNDLLSKDFYHLSKAALEVKSKAPNGVAFTSKGKLGHDGPISGNVEGKYADKATGLTLTQSWTTANSLDTKIELDEAFTPGLKGELSCSFLPTKGTKNGKLNFYFKQPSLHARAFFDLINGPTFTGDAVVGHEGFLAGAEIGYDILGGKITKYSAAAGYAAPAYTTSLTSTNNLSVFAASYYHKINSSTEAGAKATWDSKSAQDVALEVGAKHKLDSTSFAKAKINSSGVASLAYNQQLREGVNVGFGLSADTQRLNEAAHKFGVSLTFAA